MTTSHMPDFLSRMVEEAEKAPSFTPNAFFNQDGDLIEFLASDESYYAERVDSRLTVFYGQDSGELVGAMLKGVSCIVRDFTKTLPNFRLEVIDGRMHLSALISATMWATTEDKAPVRSVLYKKVRRVAEQNDVSVDIGELAGAV